MSESLEVSTRLEGSVGVVATDGYINNIGAEKVAEVCDQLMTEQITHFVFNLENSRIINSIGISILIEVIEKARELDGKVAFCCATPTVAKTFRIMGILNVATVHDTEAEALQAVSAS